MKKPMNDLKRNLLQEIIEGNPDYAYVAFHINSHSRCEEICAWLIKNKITGKKLYKFYLENCSQSILKLISFVVSKLEKEEMRPVFAHKDFNVNN